MSRSFTHTGLISGNTLSRAIAGLLSTAVCLPGNAQTDGPVNAESDPQIEEVLVTGSYLRGSPLDAPSPVQVVDREDMNAQGAVQIWDVISNMAINSGSISNEGAEGGNAEVGSLSGTANINLRNLGENSTLTLINGKRQVAAATTTASGGEFVDINTIPLVMLDRVEVLADGGSALYGSDAVAGVVNLIMRNDFEGFEVYGDLQNVENAGSRFDKTGSAIWGWQSDNGERSFVIAAEAFRRDPVSVQSARFYDERSDFSAAVGGMGTLVAQPSFGAQLNPAYINQAAMAQAIAEGGSNELRSLDPLCTQLTSADGTPYFWGTPYAERGRPDSTCREDESQWRLLNVGMERDSISASFRQALSDSAEFYGFALWSSSDIERSDSGYVTSRGPGLYLATPGAHQGNPAWGGYAIGQTAELGYFAPAIGLSRPQPGDITNAPIDIANGGPNVPMSAYVQAGNKPRTGGNTNVSRSETLTFQGGVKGEFFALNDRRFNYDVSYAWSGTSFEVEYQTFQRDRAELALNGLGGPDCTPNGVPDFDFISARGDVSPALPTFWDFLGSAFTQTFLPGYVHNTRESLSLALTSNNHGKDGCQFFNPFLTAQADPAMANSQALLDWMMPVVKRSDKRNKLAVFDAVLSGELFTMTGGEAQFALGLQYRQQNNSSIAPTINYPGLPSAILSYDENGEPDAYHYVSNNYECSQCIFNYDHDRDVKSVFTELSLPLLDSIETQIALRWESYGGNIGSQVTPKVAMSWRPSDDWLLRSSYSQSFRAPNIGIQREGLEASRATFRDPLRNQAVRAGMLAPTNNNALPNTTYTVGAPAPDIGNEKADTYGAGLQWTPGGRLEGLRLAADYWRFEVQDRVMPQPAISSIAHELDAFAQAVQHQDQYVLNSSLANDATQLYQACDPVALSAQWGDDPANSMTEAGQVIPGSRLDCVVDPRTYVVEGVVRAQGSTMAELVTIVSSAINAGEVVTDGVDLSAGYRWSSELGEFAVNSQMTYVNQYRLRNVPGLDLGLLESGEFDAAGTTGDGLLVRSLPDLKGNLTFSWSSNNLAHQATWINHFIGSYDNLSYQNDYLNGNDYVRSIISPEVDAYHRVDLQYSYTRQWPAAGSEATFTLGVLDAFNASLPFLYSGPLNYDAAVFDGRGRRLYGRVLMRF